MNKPEKLTANNGIGIGSCIHHRCCVVCDGQELRKVRKEIARKEQIIADYNRKYGKLRKRCGDVDSMYVRSLGYGRTKDIVMAISKWLLEG